MNDGNKVFVDTNIIIYAYDISAGAKHDTAKKVLEDLWSSGNGVISTQVLQEFFVNVTRKIKNPLDAGRARGIVADFLKWEVVTIEGDLLLDAIDRHRRNGFSFWDAMIISAALSSSAKSLFSEDLNDGQHVDGMTIVNPFLGKAGIPK